MTVDEFVKFYLDRWPAKSPQAFTDDARMFLSGHSGEALMRASRKLVTEWVKDRRPTVADITDICRKESPDRFKRKPGEINRKQQMDWVKDRIPELLSEWKHRNYTLAAKATENGYGGDLKRILQDAADYHAQGEWLANNGHGQRVPEFNPPEAQREAYWEPRAPSEIAGNLRFASQRESAE